MELLSSLGAELKKARISKGWTIRETAEHADLSARFVSDIEAGRGNVSVRRLANLARALDVRLVDLFAATEEKSIIALWGLRGAGKSTIGPRLAQALGVEFYELDQMVEEAAGLSLDEIFTLHGESYYRELELATLRAFLAEYDRGVIATGGGIVTNDEAFELLRERCRTVWLKANPEDHWERVIQQGDRRPMADNPRAMDELRALLRLRSPVYALADATADTSTLGVDRTVSTLVKAVGP